MFRPFKNMFVSENQLIKLFSFYYPDFHVPSEYLTNIHIRDKVSVVYLLFYSVNTNLSIFQVQFFFSSDSIFEIISSGLGYAFTCSLSYLTILFIFVSNLNIFMRS